MILDKIGKICYKYTPMLNNAEKDRYSEIMPETRENGLNPSLINMLARYRFLYILALFGILGAESPAYAYGAKDFAIPSISVAASSVAIFPSTPSNESDSMQCISTPDISPKLRELTKDLYDPLHPQSVIGKYTTDKKLDWYKKYKNGKLGIQELGHLLKRNIGKIVIWKLDPEMLFKHFAVSKFLSNRIDDACGKAGLNNEECTLYHIITFENSGELWARSSKDAVGPSQIMPQWYAYEKSLYDNLTTKNFFKIEQPENGCKTTTFDGRYDVIANVEMGARILKYFLNLFGSDHQDFAILAYNQGENNVQKFVNAWALKHKKLLFDKFKKNWRKNHKQQFAYKYFLDKLNIPLAKMLRDTDLVENHMGSDNGGAGYLSKIISMAEALKNPEKYGIKPTKIEMHSLADYFIANITNENGSPEYMWDDLFEEAVLPAGKSLLEFMKPNELRFINRHIRSNTDKFDKDVRIWVYKNNFPEKLRMKIIDDSFKNGKCHRKDVKKPVRKISKKLHFPRSKTRH